MQVSCGLLDCVCLVCINDQRLYGLCISSTEKWRFVTRNIHHQEVNCVQSALPFTHKSYLTFWFHCLAPIRADYAFRLEDLHVWEQLFQYWTGHGVTSQRRVNLSFNGFHCPPWIRSKWAKNFFAPVGIAWQFTTNTSSIGSSLTKFDCCCRLHPVCVPPLHARAKWPMIPHLLHHFPSAGQCRWRGLGWSPRHQKQAAVKVSGLRLSGVVFFVKFICSCWMPRAFFILNWFANVVALILAFGYFNDFS